MVEGVPARVCQQCGERAYSDQVMDVLERVRDGQCVPARLRHVDVYEFSEAAQAGGRRLGGSTLAPSLIVRGRGTL